MQTLWQFSKTNCATSYGHGWRNDVVNQCLEAVHMADRMKLHTAENTAHCCHSLRNTKWVLLVLQYLFITLLYCNKQNFSLKPEVIPGYTLNGSTISFLQKQNVHTDDNKCMKNTHTHIAANIKMQCLTFHHHPSWSTCNNDQKSSSMPIKMSFFEYFSLIYYQLNMITPAQGGKNKNKNVD